MIQQALIIFYLKIHKPLLSSKVGFKRIFHGYSNYNPKNRPDNFLPMIALIIKMLKQLKLTTKTTCNN